MISKVKYFFGAVFILIASSALVYSLWYWSSMGQNGVGTPMNSTTGIILFFGQECPHCKDLEKIIEEEKLNEKVSFDSLEVWHNMENRKVFLEKGFECGYTEDQLGVPFLYARGKCFVGTPDIEEFLKQEAGIK